MTTISNNLQMSLFDPVATHSHKFTKHLPKVSIVEQGPPLLTVWDIPATIRELSYLTHSHYRYYGKFPSVVAGQLLEQFPPNDPSDYVYDHFCGSGTTLVEAKLRGIASYGSDLSWLACLASNVKVRHIDLQIVRQLAIMIMNSKNLDVTVDNIPIDIRRWFTEKNCCDLLRIQGFLKEIPRTDEAEFLYVAFIAIVRRVSRAFDAEVRPHINKNKPERDVYSAFDKKVREMIADHTDFMAITSHETPAICEVADARFNEGLSLKAPYLTISHPPYLNSFNYGAVFKLEFYWGEPFRKFSDASYQGVAKAELKAHPAVPGITQKYFDFLRDSYKNISDRAEEGSKLAVVVGDCTRNGEIIRVVKKITDIVCGMNFRLIEHNSRTTHYGLGKYAYNHRSHYHGEAADKEDAIIVFEKI